MSGTTAQFPNDPISFATNLGALLKDGHYELAAAGVVRRGWRSFVYSYTYRRRPPTPPTALTTFCVPSNQPLDKNLVPLVSQPLQSGVQIMQQLRDDAQVIVVTSNFRDAKGGPVSPTSFTYGVSDTNVLGLADVSADGLTATVLGVGIAGQTAQLQRSGVNPDGSAFQLAPIDIQLTGGEVASADSAFGEQTPMASGS